MKNIYQDDSYNPDSEDLFSTPGGGQQYFQAPERPGIDFDADSVQMPSSSAQKPVRSARHAPPPIKRTAPVVTPGQTQPQSAAYPGAESPYGQQPYYPQPVYYPGVPVQPYPVYPAQGQPYPVYPQGMPYPPQGYVQAPQYPPQPVMQTPPSAYPPAQQQAYTTPPVSDDPLSREAGTRVLFQSADFDKKDDTADSYDYDTSVRDYKAPPAFDVSEVELPSKKRAGKPPVSPEHSFNVDEMEISTYELSAMSLSRHAKTTDVKAPLTQTAPEAFAPQITEDAQAEEEYTYALPDDLPGDLPGEDAPVPLTEEEATQEEKPAEEKKKTPPSEIIRKLVLAVSAVAILVSAYMLYNEYRLHEKNKETMSSVSDLLITEAVTEPSTEASTTAPAKPEDSNKQTTENTTTTKVTTTRPLTPLEQFELLKKQNPDITFPANMQIKYAKLYAENQDFVGYLSAEGTDIDFPIVQGADDDEYIEKDFFGEYTKYGCPFMTSKNNAEILDMNTLIYGHHMRDGSLFATLDQYTTLEGYKEAPVINFNTLYQDYSFKVIAVMITNINAEDDNGYVFPYYWTNLNNTLNYTAYLNQLAQRSLYDTGVNVLPTDRLLTLSTCYSEFENARLVVVARLVRPGESTTVDTSKAVENPNPRYPQAYYDEHKLTNPYQNAYRWKIT